MADKRDSLVAAIVAALGDIATADGYNSDLGKNVFEWRPKTVTPDGIAFVVTAQRELPAIHVRDTNDVTTAIETDGTEEHVLTVEFEIAHQASASGAQMRGQVADVRAALGVDPTLGGLAEYRRKDFTADTIRLAGEHFFFKTLITAKFDYITSAFAES